MNNRLTKFSIKIVQTQLNICRLLILSCLLFLTIFSPALTNAQSFAEDVLKKALAPPEGDDRKLFVLQFRSTGMTESAARAFSHMIARNLDNTNRFEIVPLDGIEQEIQKQDPSLLPCFEIGCGIQIGSIMKLDWLLSGRISLTPSGLFNLNVKLVHIFDNALSFEDTIRFSDENMDRRFYQLANRIANNAPLAGNILEANNKIAVINLGEQSGISVGDQLVIYKTKAMEDTTRTNIVFRKRNIGILKITRVGKGVSEGVFFQIIEPPESGQFVLSYLNKRKQITLIDKTRKELDTQQRNVYEIKKSVELSPVQLEDIAKKKWKRRMVEISYQKEYWQYFMLGSGVASAYFLSQFQSGDDLKLLAAIGAFSFSTFKFFTLNATQNDLKDEGRYRGYIDLKIRPDLGEAKLEFIYRF